MRKIVLLAFVAALIFSCGNQKKQAENTVENTEKAATVYTVDELYANAAELAGKEVTVKGTVMHVCKQGGGRCFLMGSTEDSNIRIEAGEKIGAFSQEQMGSDLTITGIFKEVKTEADAHNPAREHGEDGHEHDADTDDAHRVIAEAQEAAQVVYFMEGVKIVAEE
ncbi:hypothetical protein SAMN05444274_10184 [Mariniphaga anaerophila]|uniref:DUF4920 domain-containing protein n=1 Tax=Mariniphaga anaerophila TaxID=1484053 RepID=A0A1M4SMJ9_9BACT|nr:hypothetical protein [Mariniphaga anaerophila]SHE33494.1 hypothetical protein SAMN05444274_10184 [Mariniphaga anaerophila]